MIVEKQTLRVLKAARKLITNPKRWCQGAYGRTADGRCIDKDYTLLATCTQFCGEGAVYRAADKLGGSTYEAINILNAVTPDHSMIYYNDSERTTHEKVLKMFDKAIARAEKRVLAAQKRGKQS